MSSPLDEVGYMPLSVGLAIAMNVLLWIAARREGNIHAWLESVGIVARRGGHLVGDQLFARVSRPPDGKIGERPTDIDSDSNHEGAISKIWRRAGAGEADWAHERAINLKRHWI